MGLWYQGMLHQNSSLNLLHKQFIETYQKEGESTWCVNILNTYTKNYYKNLKQSPSYKCSLKNIIADSKFSNKHVSISLVKNDAFKVSLHVMPNGFEIPMHAHPNQFSLIIVESGILEIGQYSWGAALSKNSARRVMKKGESCIGLPVKDNLHHLKVGSDGVIFLSIRMNSVEQLEQNRSTLVSLMIKKLIPSVLCLLLPVMSSMTTRAGETYELYSGYKGATYKDFGSKRNVLSSSSALKPMSRSQARKFRLSSHYESQVEAVNWYLKSARRGNAESQYWLGVMHLDGSGTTEDDDEAFKWVSLSADQGYKPAEKLLDHLITSDFDLEC